MSPPGRKRLILGLMSGTSHDGVDAALAEVDPHNWRLIHHTHIPYSSSFSARIAAAFSTDTAEVCALNFALGAVLGRAALRCAAEAGVALGDIDAIASHGQTLHHAPPRGRGRGSTLQVGESAVIAKITGVKVVSDFRAADMALGGQGAPLMSWADYRFFGDRATCLAHNIGGVSNVTLVTPKLEGVMAFDTGPGNALIDEAMRVYFGKPMDRAGKTAAGAMPDARLLGTLLRHPYLRKKPPKSTGHEEFGPKLLSTLDERVKDLSPGEVVCTLTHFTARSIGQAYHRHIPSFDEVREVIFSGGGTLNTFLMGLIRRELHPLKVITVDELGIPSAAKEALGFALIAYETLRGRTASLPQATGASAASVLGKITLP